jgi:ssDNA-binding Zn-finger/Zn-ribbon topoisomerase 1
MATEASPVVGDDKVKDSQSQECPKCGNEMSMTRIIRTEGPSGMFWVCDDYSCGTVVNKSGVEVEQLNLT